QISGPDQVWCSDITYVPMAYGFMYLVAVMDWRSRYVLAWELSNSLDSEFCIRAWTAALAGGSQPLISNTDQGSQFTSEAYLEAVESVGVDVSMDGRAALAGRITVPKCSANRVTTHYYYSDGPESYVVLNGVEISHTIQLRSGSYTMDI